MAPLGAGHNTTMQAPLFSKRYWRQWHVPRLRPRALAHNPWLIALVLVAVALVALRLALPWIATNSVNRTLNSLPGYEGRVADVDIHLWRGAYSIHDVSIDKVDITPAGKFTRVPMFSSDTIDLSVEWGQLLRGAIVGQVELHRPALNIFAGPARKEQGRAGDDFFDRLRELMPLNINRLAIIDGELHFRNYAASPDIDIYLRDVNAVVRNLTNTARIDNTLAATVSASGRAMDSGNFTLEMKLDPFEKRPTYDLAFELKNLRLPELNDYLRHYLAVAARDGRLSLYAESSAKEGRFRGYVKPIVVDLDVLKIKRERTMGETVKAFFVKLMSKVFENKPQEQLATKLEFAGDFADPNIGVWEAVIEFFRNAFVEALPAGLDGSVAPAQVGIEQGMDARSRQADKKEQRKARQERNALERENP